VATGNQQVVEHKVFKEKLENVSVQDKGSEFEITTQHANTITSRQKEETDFDRDLSKFEEFLDRTYTKNTFDGALIDIFTIRTSTKRSQDGEL
jgi:hypothetical protein